MCYFSCWGRGDGLVGTVFVVGLSSKVWGMSWSWESGPEDTANISIARMDSWSRIVVFTSINEVFLGCMDTEPTSTRPFFVFRTTLLVLSLPFFTPHTLSFC